MPKVLHIGPCDTPGGMANVMRILAEHPPEGWFAELLPSHCKGSPWAKWRAYRRARNAFSQMLRDEKRRPDMIHIHTAADWSWWRKRRFAQIAHKARIPNIVHIHSGQFDSWLGSSSKRAQKFNNDIQQYNSQVVVLSESWKEQLSQYFGDAVAIHNPMKPELEFGQAITREPNKILFLARDDAVKGGLFAQRLIESLRQKFPDLVLAMSGISQSRNSWVLPLGWMTEAEKMHQLETATVLIVPSKFEGQPMVALEAIASGTPVLLSDTIHSLPPEIPKAKFEDIEDWQDKLEQILTSPQPMYPQSILEAYTLSNIQESWKELYESLFVQG